MSDNHRLKWSAETAEFVPVEMIELQNELSRYEHRHLKYECELEGYTTFSEVIGKIAADCDLVLDGYYSNEDIRGICKKLSAALRKKRDPIAIYTGEHTGGGN